MLVRRVVLIILAMLIIPDLLSVSDEDKYVPAGIYGADEVAEAFDELLLDEEGGRLRYERRLLRYMYHQNWFAGAAGCASGEPSGSCPAAYFGRVFWVGFRGRDASLVRDKAGRARVRAGTVASWERNVSRQGAFKYSYGGMPPAAQSALAAPWGTDCSSAGTKMLGLSLLASAIPGLVDLPVRCPSEIRLAQIKAFLPASFPISSIEACHLVFFFDMRPYFRAEARNSLFLTGFLCMMLCVATMALAADANHLVLYPLEDMIQKVNEIRNDPLKAVNMADRSFRSEERARAKTQEGWSIKKFFKCEAKSRSGIMETRVLEKTIIKLGSLLALGFGQAGVNIIGQNMRESDAAGVDVMIPGQRVECVIGHARILHFAVATEVLQSKIMSFVNQVAEIVHGVVDEFLGAVNKNTGDAYLLLWVLGDPESDDRQADLSIVAFSKIQGAIARSHKLAAYREHPLFQQRLGPDYRVELLLGLHAGWAIEGAVGSEFKIDASYISPNVSLSESIACASEAYGVRSLLASEAVVMLCHQECRQHCRQIDRALIPGSGVPIGMYCVDLDPRSLKVSEDTSHRIPWNPRQRFKVRQFLEAEKEKKRRPHAGFQPCHFFHTDGMLVQMQAAYTEDFKQVFKMGYKNYLEGEWLCAKTFLSRTWNEWGFEDGPSRALLNFMEQHHFVAPEGWPGFRELHSTAFLQLESSSPSPRMSLKRRSTLGSSRLAPRRSPSKGSLFRGSTKPMLPPCPSPESTSRCSTSTSKDARRTAHMCSEEASLAGREYQALPDRAFKEKRISVCRAVQDAPVFMSVMPPKGDTGPTEWQWDDDCPVEKQTGPDLCDAMGLKRVRKSGGLSRSRTRQKEVPVPGGVSTDLRARHKPTASTRLRSDIAARQQCLEVSTPWE